MNKPLFLILGSLALAVVQSLASGAAFGAPAESDPQPQAARDKAPTDPAAFDLAMLDQWSAPYRGWQYWPEHVVPAAPEIAGATNILGTDVPTVYQLPGDPKFYMSFVTFDGRGYQSYVGESGDLVHWGNYRLAMGFGPKDEFDHGGCVIGAFLYDSYDIKAPRKGVKP